MKGGHGNTGYTLNGLEYGWMGVLKTPSALPRGLFGPTQLYSNLYV